MLRLIKPQHRSRAFITTWQSTCGGEPVRAADCRAVLDVNQCVMRATCSEERRYTGGIHSPSPETIPLMTVCSHIDLPAQTYPQFIAFAFRILCVCVCFLCFNYTLLCTLCLNEFIITSRTSIMSTSTKLLCLTQGTLCCFEETFNICLSFVFHFCRNKFSILKTKMQLVEISERLGGRQKIGELRHNMIKPKQDYTKSNFCSKQEAHV